jgi:hypothetical protein
MLRRVALLRTDVSEERIASIIMVIRIGEQGTETRFLQEPYGETFQKTDFFRYVYTLHTQNNFLDCCDY